MIKYVRPGDLIISQSALELCDTAGDFIELALNLLGKNVYLICKNEKIDTSLAYWKFIKRKASEKNPDTFRQRANSSHKTENPSTGKGNFD